MITKRPPFTPLWLLILGLLLLPGCGQLVYHIAGASLAEDSLPAATAVMTGSESAVTLPDPSPTPPPATPTPPPAATATPAPSPTPTATLPPPTFTNPPNPELASLAAAHGVEFVPMQPQNTGLWQFAPGQFSHPIDLLWLDQTAYLLDRGRLLAVALTQPTPPQILLQPGDLIPANETLLTPAMPVQEPLALAQSNGRLWLLDRVGDVYGYAPDQGWWLDRYDRPIGTTSSHYFVALAASEGNRYLFDTSYNYVFGYQANGILRGWTLPPGRGVGLALRGEQVYVLSHHVDNQEGRLRLYLDGARLDRFSPTVTFARPRQVVATDTAVYLLDQAGARLLALHPDRGTLLAVYQPPAGVTAVAAAPDGRLLLAAPDRLYFYGQPDRLAHMTELVGETAVSFTPESWLTERPLLLPVAGHAINQRDLQMPGAPRHYRYGIHEGLDFYWALGTPVRAVAAGVVVRAMTDYPTPTPNAFDQWRNQSATLGYTSAEALDFYRGQQVWLLHDDGLVARYAHLSQIVPGITLGQRVEAGQTIGAIGNSGSPASVQSETEDAHLHFELWRDDVYLGQYLRPVEARELLQHLFGTP